MRRERRRRRERAPGAGDAVIDQNATLRVGYGTPPQSLDPHVECHIGCRPYWIPIFETLYDVGEGTQTLPLLADGMPEYSEDGLQLTIRLEQGHTFHDGTPIDAEAVKLSMERGKTLPDSTAAPTLRQVTTIEAVDEHTVRLTLAAPRPGFESELTGPAGAVISPVALADGRDLGLDPGDAGSGPYRVETFTPNESVTFTAVEDYWMEHRGRLGTVVTTAITDNNTGLNALQSGQLDLVFANNLLSDPSRAQPLENADFEVHSYETLNAHAILLRSSLGELSDERVRRALNHAIDRQVINESLYFGDCEPTSQVFRAPLPAHVPGYDPFPYDPDRARALLAEAGLPDGFELTITTVTGNPTSEQNAAVVQQMLGEVGVDVRLSPMSSPEGSAAFNRNELEARSTVVSNRADSLGTLDFHFMPGGAGHMAEQAGDELSGLRDRLGQADDTEGQSQILQEMGRLVSDGAFTIPICFMNIQWASTTRVEGLDEMYYTAFGSGLDIRGLAMTTED